MINIIKGVIMGVIWIIINFIAVFLFIIFIIYHIYYVINIRYITKQLKEIIEAEETNKILTVAAKQKDIVNLVDMLNNMIVGMRKSHIKIKNITRQFRESIINISHDLRTPLTTASGYVQMLQTDITEEERKEYLEIVLERQNMVKVLLEQLFEYVRIEAGEITYKFEYIDAKKIFIDTLAMYYDDFNSKGESPVINMLDNPCIIYGDEQGLQRIFSNILFNAVIHGLGNYTFEIKESKDEYLFIFSNGSEFINAEDIDRIFERFYTRDKSRSKKTTGLGLCIAKEITNQLNGEINAFYEDRTFSIVVKFLKQGRGFKKC